MGIKCRVSGYEVRKGEFSPADQPDKKVSFENFLFHFVTDDNPDVVGTATSIFGCTSIKIPAKDLKKVAKVDSPDQLVGKDVSPFWAPKGKDGIALLSLDILPSNK